MPLREWLGRTVSARLQRRDALGAWLVPLDAQRAPGPAPDEQALRLPLAELQADAQLGAELEVFVYLDSEDLPVATTRAPAVELGEVAFLSVTDLTPFGAFVDWGLPKDLLVPFKEQTRELALGDREPIGLKLDKTGRLAGTMRVSEMLRARGEFTRNEWVEGEAWRNDPEIGLFVIVERTFVGLLPAHEPHQLRRGQRASFRVAHSHNDGKIELSLRRLAHDEIDADAQHVLEQLTLAGARPLSERTDPEEIRARFGLSKKAWKRAIGRLLRDGAVVLDAHGHIVPVMQLE